MIDFHFCFEAVLKPGHKAVVTETWTQQLCGVGWRQAAFVSISHMRACSPPELCPTLLWPPWNADCQAPLSRGFPSKSIGVGCYFLLQGMDLPDPGIEPASPRLAGRFFTTEPPEKPSSVPRTCFFFPPFQLQTAFTTLDCFIPTQKTPSHSNDDFDAVVWMLVEKPCLSQSVFHTHLGRTDTTQTPAGKDAASRPARTLLWLPEFSQGAWHGAVGTQAPHQYQVRGQERRRGKEWGHTGIRQSLTTARKLSFQ